MTEPEALDGAAEASMISECGPEEERQPLAPARDCVQIYLELLKRCLTDRYRVDGDSPPYEILSPRPGRSLRGIVGNGLKRVLRANGIFLCRPRQGWRHVQARIKDREEGRDWPERVETMIGLKRLSNIQYCLEDVLRRGIKGTSSRREHGEAMRVSSPVRSFARTACMTAPCGLPTRSRDSRHRTRVSTRPTPVTACTRTRNSG